MSRWIPSVLLALTLGVPGCGRQAPSATPGAPPSHAVFAMREASRSWSSDTTRAREEVKVSFAWPEFSAAPSTAALDSLNSFVRETMVAPSTRGTASRSIDSLMTQFIDDFRAYRKDFPEAEGGWYLKRRVEVVGDTLGVVSLAVTEESYGGGAHPNAMTRYVTYDARRAARLGLGDLVALGPRDSLERLGEAEFRRVRQLARDADLAEAGFYFKDDRFHLNENFAVTPRGLLFYFNDYEIGPHALGPTEIVLGWSAVGRLLRPDGPLGAMARAL